MKRGIGDQRVILQSATSPEYFLILYNGVPKPGNKEASLDIEFTQVEEFSGLRNHSKCLLMRTETVRMEEVSEITKHIQWGRDET